MIHGPTSVPPSPGPIVGRNLSDLPIELSDGSVRTLSEFAGQTIVLIHSANSWDPVVKEQKAQYERVLKQFPELDAGLVELAGVHGEYQLRSEHGEQFDVPIFRSCHRQSSLIQAFGLSPADNALFVIDESGTVRWAHIFSFGASAKPDDLGDVLRGLQLPNSAPRVGLTRRQFLAASFAGAFIVTLSLDRASTAVADPSGPAGLLSGSMRITLNINGTDRTLAVDPRVTLLDALRERLALTGSKKGCDHGQCGTCTVHIDGRRINSCLTLAVACQGKKVRTIEGVANADTLHPLQQAFIKHDSFQCGYCTSGQIMSALALGDEGCGPTDDDVREAMSGNICRCGAYPNIVDAIQQVRSERGSNVSL